MKIKDQIRARREQLGISIAELAKRVDVSGQAVRHWESGRSFPGKSIASAVEAALSIRLDWTEGDASAEDRPEMATLVKQGDLDLFLTIAQLPLNVKVILGELAKSYLAIIEGSKNSFSERSKGGGVPAFAPTGSKNPVGVSSAKHKPLSKQTEKHSSPRKKAA